MRRKITALVMPLPNFANVQMHWRSKARIVADQREAVTEALLDADWGELLETPPTAENPWRVTLLRVSPQQADDDGVTSSLKGVRDAFASFVGVDDKHKHIVKYVYEDDRGPKVGVEIYVERVSAGGA